MKEMSGCGMEPPHLKAAWRSARVVNGEQCAIMVGTTLMQELSVDSLGFLWQVLKDTIIIQLPVLSALLMFSLALANHSAQFGAGSGPILLNYVACTGLETALHNCTSQAVRYCSHSRDAGVTCQIKTGNFTKPCYPLIVNR